jgi:hypothetical protein
MPAGESCVYHLGSRFRGHPCSSSRAVPRFDRITIKQQDKPYVLKTLNRLIPLFSSEPLDRHLWIVENERVRIRD